MVERSRVVAVAWRVGAVVAAFALGVGAARLLGGCGAYHRRPASTGTGGTASRAVVEEVLTGGTEERELRVLVRSGEHSGKQVVATEVVRHRRGRGALRPGQRCVVFVRETRGGLSATVSARERDGFLMGMAWALAVLLVLTCGRKGVATVCGIVWAVVLLVGVVVPAVRAGGSAGLLCVPVAALIAAPTLAAIGGWNRKSLAAIAGTVCGVAAGGLLSVGFAHAMQLTGLEAEFGPYEHMDNRLWFATGLRRVDFAGLLVGGMLLAGLGAVMDVSMAVASTVSEVRRAAPGARGWALFGPGLSAGRDIIGVMVLTLALVFVGGELMFFVSVGQTGWAARWLLLANYEELAAELVRVAAAGLGMAVCVPASAALGAVLYGRRGGDGEGAG